VSDETELGDLHDVFQQVVGWSRRSRSRLTSGPAFVTLRPWKRNENLIYDYGLLNTISQVPAVRDALHRTAEMLKKHLK
jgi:hypothetical protein